MRCFPPAARARGVAMKSKWTHRITQLERAAQANNCTCDTGGGVFVRNEDQTDEQFLASITHEQRVAYDHECRAHGRGGRVTVVMLISADAACELF
jgi:hypothetical protein